VDVFKIERWVRYDRKWQDQENWLIYSHKISLTLVIFLNRAWESQQPMKWVPRSKSYLWGWLPSRFAAETTHLDSAPFFLAFNNPRYERLPLECKKTLKLVRMVQGYGWFETALRSGRCVAKQGLSARTSHTLGESPYSWMKWNRIWHDRPSELVNKSSTNTTQGWLHGSWILSLVSFL